MSGRRVGRRVPLGVVLAMAGVIAFGVAPAAARVSVEPFFGKDALPYAWVTGVFPDGDDVWVSTKGGTRIYNVADKTWRAPAGQVEGNVVTGLARFGGLLYVATDQALNIQGPDGWRSLRQVAKANAANGTLLATETELWLAARTMTGGLLRFDGKDWTLQSRGAGTGVLNNVTRLATWSGGLWAGTTNSGVYLLKSGIWTIFGPEHGLPGLWVTSLAGPAGWLCAGTPNGLGFFDGAVWKTLRTADGLPSNKISALEVYKDGIIIGMFDRGIALFDGKRFEAIGLAEGLSDDRVETLAVVRDTLWVGTVNGLSLVRFS